MFLLAAPYPSEVGEPQVTYPQHAQEYPGPNHHGPRRPRPRRHSTIAGVESHHPHEPDRPEDRPHGRVSHVERERQRGVRPGGQRRVGPSHAGQCPQVLREAGGLGEHLQGEQPVGATTHGGAAGGEDVERCEVVRHEERLVRQEDEVVEEVDGEVGRAEVEDEVVGGRVGRREVAGRRVGQHGAQGEQRRRRAVEERRQAAGRVRPVLPAPAAEHDEVAKEVDGREHRKKRQEHGGRRRGRSILHSH